DRQSDRLAELLGETGNGDGGAGQHGKIDIARSLLHGVVVERVADIIGDPSHALAENVARLYDDLPVSLDVVDRQEQADVLEPAVRVLEGQPPALRQFRGHGFRAVGNDTGENARRAHRHGDVGHTSDADVQGGAVTSAAMQ